MTLYTPIPWEIVYEGADKLQAPTEITVSGIVMQVHYAGQSEAQIVRLISPDPQHYLNPAFQPGTTIRLVPQFGSKEV